MSAARYLERLRVKLIDQADASLKAHPDDPSAFGYGKAIGIQMGLKMAEELYQSVLNEQEVDIDAGDRLKPPQRR
jgi:hypothetical protein